MNFKEYCFNSHVLRESIQDLQDSSKQYNQLIAKVLVGDPKQTAQIPTPVGDYKLGVNFTVNPQDKASFAKLFPLTPPKGPASVEDDTVGTKGSGNGEIALFKKPYSRRHKRGR